MAELQTIHNIDKEGIGVATTTKVITCCVFFFALYFSRISAFGSKNIVILDSLNFQGIYNFVIHTFFFSQSWWSWIQHVNHLCQ